MTIIYSILCFILAIVLLIKARHIKKDNNKWSRELFLLFINDAMTIAVYGAAIIANNKLLANVLYSFYFAFSTWLVISLCMFISNYANNYRLNKIARIFLVIITSLDSVFLLSNIFINKIFLLESINIVFGYNAYVPIRLSLYYNHFVYIYTLALVLIIILLVKSIKTKGIYRRKYLSILISFILIIFMNFVDRFINSRLEYGVLLYGLIAFAISYFVYKYIPKVINKSVKNLIVDNLNDAVLGFDHNLVNVYANDMAKKVFKTDDEEKFTNIFKKIYLEQGLETVDQFTWNTKVKRGKGFKYYMFSYKKMYDNKDVYIGDYLIIHDSTEKEKKTQDEKKLISHDLLTGLYNKNIFEIKVNELIQNTDLEYYMVCTDIKNFKLINEYFGEKTGDEILISLAKILDNEFKNNDLVVYSRLQGDKFAIFLPKYVYEKSNIYNKLKVVSKMIDNLNVYLYMGIYPVSKNDNVVSVMIDNASLASSLIKTDYKKFINFYDDDIKASMVNENRLVNSFYEALKRKEFVFYIQPQISNEGKVLGGEALVRWIRDGEIVPPGKFISVFEKTGLISELDKFVWEQAVKKLKDWKEKGIDYYLSINLSIADFFSMDIFKVITGLVRKYNVDPKKLKLEITESVFVGNTRMLNETINKFKKDGYIIEMDDFGSGYSSLNMLKSIDVDVIKMDMGFLYDEDKLNKSRLILKTLINLSKELGLEVVTEGVETESQKEYLKSIGCDIFQGYYFDKPMSIEEFEKKYGGK